MMTEFREASASPSPPSRSPPSPVEIMGIPSHSSNLRQNLFHSDFSSNRFSFQSSIDYSRSSSFSNGFCSSADTSPFPSPPFNGVANHIHASTMGYHSEKNVPEADDLGLCKSLNRMNIRDDVEEEKARYGRIENQGDVFGSILESDHTDFTLDPLCNVGGYQQYERGNGFVSGGFPFDFSGGFGIDKPTFARSKGFTVADHNQFNGGDSWFNNNQTNSGFNQMKSEKRNVFGMNNPSQTPYTNPYIADSIENYRKSEWPSYSNTGNHYNHYNHYTNDGFLGHENFGLGSNRGKDSSYSCFSPRMAQPEMSYNLGYKASNTLPPLFCQDSELFSSEENMFMESTKSLDNGVDTYNIPSMPQRRSSKEFADHGNADIQSSIPNMADIQGYVYLMAKDQHGCRFLQRIFDEGTDLDAIIIFNEVIAHVVELMMDPFGNYLMQKLLDVCTEEQRTQIVLVATAEPGQLIRISLNAYGTRVVQKLVETIRTGKQISLVKSALRPGFLDLIKDLNGNHVIQRCLQCLTTEDNKFIFDAATKYCTEIATHRHGCCVLQKCIAFSMRQQREKLISEISRNSLLLSQDPFGNYAVQFVIELRTPSAVAMMLAQLKGHYVQLSMQKFSSHMVERCLTHCPESRPQIVRELVSVQHFDQLLQDPFANFVIQAALAVTKGPLHASLLEAIRPHTFLRNNPYCKRIFSRNLLKK